MIDFALLTPYILGAILLALIFDFYNGVNDAANSIATVVATRALQPLPAVLMAAFFNFVGAFVIGTAVAATVGKGIVVADFVTTTLIVAALFGGLAWNVVASYNGLPISVSHCLIGGLLGAGLAAGGTAALQLPTLDHLLEIGSILFEGAAVGALAMMLIALLARGKHPTLPLIAGTTLGSSVWLVVTIATGVFEVQKLAAVFLFIVYSPVLGFVLAYAFTYLIGWLARNFPPAKTNRVFRWMQLGSSSFYSLGHGTNDAQKTMGVLTALLVANGVLADFTIPLEVIVAAGLSIALGTFIGGYKVVRTMGHKLTQLEPYQGFSAETSSALGLFFLAQQGIPVSTTHSIAGAIMGVGATRSTYAVSWGIARRIFMAWIITIPASLTVAAFTYFLVRAVAGS